MAYSPILLGTANNNDGDSLYAGGSKINANFVELYTALGGSSSNTLRIAVGATAPGQGSSLRWSTSSGKYISTSSDSIKTLGAVDSNKLFITNYLGQAGVDNEFSGAGDSLYLTLNGKSMLYLLSRNTSTTLLTKGEMNFTMGNSNVIPISIYTTSIVVRGVNGLQVYAAQSEDVAVYTQLLGSTSTGIILYNAPQILGTVTVSGTTSLYGTVVLSGSTVKAVTDSSLAVAHTGLVSSSIADNMSKVTLSSTTLVAGSGLTGGGDLTATRSFFISPRFYPEHIQGYLFDADNTLPTSAGLGTIRVYPGACSHYSFFTTGATRIAETSVLAFVTTTSMLARTWSTGWTTTAGGNAVIDTTATPPLSTWYYIYLLGNVSTGATDFVMSSSNNINVVSSLVAAITTQFQIVRRIGAVYTDESTTGWIKRFQTTRLAGNSIRYSWSLKTQLNPFLNNLYDTGLLTTVLTSSVATTSNLGNIPSSNTTTFASPTLFLNAFGSSIVNGLPPIPGITGRLTVAHNPTTVSSHLVLFGEAWYSSITTRPPLTIIKSTVAAAPNYHDISIPITPDLTQIDDAAMATASLRAGAKIRQVTLAPGNSGTSNGLYYICQGFDFAR